MEDVRAPALDQRGPLRHAEAVLLVDDCDREIAEVDLLLDERMRPDDDLRITRGDQLADDSVLLRPQRARQQRDADAEGRAQLVDREEVLLGERLGRRHQRALPPHLDRAEQRMQRDDRLPGSDLSLEEPLHGDGPVEIRVDLRHRALLVRSEGERERRPITRDELARRGRAAAPKRSPVRRPCAGERAGGRGARRTRAAPARPRLREATGGDARRRARPPG